MEKEIWKDIPGYEGRYQANTEGRIRSLDRDLHGVCHYTGESFTRTMRGRILRPGEYCKAGHVSVVLGHGMTGKPVHQLVALTFLGECPEGCEVLHNNGNPKDNRIDNLRYGTRTENILDVFRQGGKWRKLSIDDVHAIRFGLWCRIKGTELAVMYGVSPQIISQIKHGRIFTWLR